jgi:hypothetical protein
MICCTMLYIYPEKCDIRQRQKFIVLRCSPSNWLTMACSFGEQSPKLLSFTLCLLGRHASIFADKASNIFRGPVISLLRLNLYRSFAMSSQACEPCSRRKVRCDKQQPCSNCKRRKQDQCIYPEATPIDRIKKLESLVKSLGGDPSVEDSRPQKRVRTGPSPTETQDAQDARDTTEAERGQPIMLEQNGESYYVEMRAWHSHLGQEDNQPNGHNHDVLMSRPLISRTKPDALKGLMQTDYAIDLSSQHPTIQDANFLWDRFERNANPLIKIDFDWVLKQVRTSSTTLESRMILKDEEHTFVFCVYLMSVVSIPPEECERVLRRPKQALLSHYQAICEQALSRCNIFCITNTTLIRAIVLYTVGAHPLRYKRPAKSFSGRVYRETEHTEFVLTHGSHNTQRREARHTS